MVIRTRADARMVGIYRIWYTLTLRGRPDPNLDPDAALGRQYTRFFGLM